jgi:hypothetical protein
VTGLELRLVDSDSLGLCPVDSGSPWLVVIPKSKRTPQRCVKVLHQINRCLAAKDNRDYDECVHPLQNVKLS